MKFTLETYFNYRPQVQSSKCSFCKLTVLTYRRYHLTVTSDEILIHSVMNVYYGSISTKFVGWIISKPLFWNTHDQGFRWLVGQHNSRSRKTKVVLWRTDWTAAPLEIDSANPCRRLISSFIGLNYLIWTIWLFLVTFPKLSMFKRKSA